MAIEASKRKHQVQLIDNASRNFEKVNHIASLQSIHAVTDACYSELQLPMGAAALLQPRASSYHLL